MISMRSFESMGAHAGAHPTGRMANWGFGADVSGSRPDRQLPGTSRGAQCVCELSEKANLAVGKRLPHHADDPAGRWYPADAGRAAGSASGGADGRSVVWPRPRAQSNNTVIEWRGSLCVRPQKTEAMSEYTPTDGQIDQLVKAGWLAIGLSQTDLAEVLDASFQQGKENGDGSNWVDADRLMQIAEALDIPLEFFQNQPARAEQREGELAPAPGLGSLQSFLGLR